MAQQRTITKVLAGEEDLLFKGPGGATTVTQTRQSGPVTVTPLNIVGVVSSTDEMRQLTSRIYEVIILTPNDEIAANSYFWEDLSVADDDGYNVIKPADSDVGRWTIDPNSKITPLFVAKDGGVQGDSPILPDGFTVVTTVATPNASVTMPDTEIKGRSYKVSNITANDLQIFPAVGAKFDSGAADAPKIVPAGTAIMFISTLANGGSWTTY